MTRRYDGKTTSFSSEGRLLQVENAFESINKSTPTVGILTSEGKTNYINFQESFWRPKSRYYRSCSPRKSWVRRSTRWMITLFARSAEWPLMPYYWLRRAEQNARNIRISSRSQCQSRRPWTISARLYITEPNMAATDPLECPFSMPDMISITNSSCIVRSPAETLPPGKLMF